MLQNVSTIRSPSPANTVTRKMAPYDVDDPRYIAELKEDMERTKAVTIEQIQDVYQRLVGASVGELTIIGDFDKDLVVPAVDEFTKGWTSGSRLNVFLESP